MSYAMWHQPTYGEGLRSADPDKEFHRRRLGRRRPRRRVRVPAVVVALALVAGLLGPGATDVLAASGPSTMAHTPVDRMVQSTGNLYWTSHVLNEFGASSASVYRASKGSTPGAERALYTEWGSGYFFFGDLTYAATNDWYGYFVANYPASGVSQIKRIPLAGGAAVTLATSPSYVGLRDLHTDGAHLFWADNGGLRRMPIGGGPIATLTTDTAIANLGLDGTRVIYTSGSQVRSVSKSGGYPVVHWSATTKLTALDVFVDQYGTYASWGEAGGAVKNAQILARGAKYVLTFQGATAGRSVTSVGWDGARMLWTDCATPGGSACAVRKHQAGRTIVVSSGGAGAQNVLGDAGSMFWSDALPKRYVH